MQRLFQLACNGVSLAVSGPILNAYLDPEIIIIHNRHTSDPTKNNAIWPLHCLTTSAARYKNLLSYANTISTARDEKVIVTAKLMCKGTKINYPNLF